LRIYNHKYRSKLQVSEELGLLQSLQANGISVAYPIANGSGEFIDEIIAPEGTRFAVLFSFAEGGKVRFLTAENRSIGVLMGRFHALTMYNSIGRIQYSVDVLAGWPYNQLRKHFSEHFDEMPFIRTCERRLEQAFTALPRIRQGVVHLDIWYDNLSVREDGQATLFDFDNCGNGWLILDIGYYCMQLYYTETDKLVYELKKAAFIEGYRSVIPVSEEELSLVPWAGLAIWIYYAGLQAERFEHFANLFLSENYLRMYMGKVREWLKYHDLEIA